jgi:polyhydroxyalkanoate synthesis regulator phasin
MSKRLVGTGLAIGLVAGAGAGLILEMSGNAGAATGPSAAAVVGDSTDDTVVDTTDDTASADPVRPDPSARLQEILKSLVDDGTITQDQADKVVAALVAAGPVGFPGGHRGVGGPGKLIRAGLDVVATTLGITEDEVRTALESGQSIADLAVSKGKTAQDVIDAIVAEATTRINAAVTDGKLTQERADELIANLTTGVTELVNSTPPLGGPGLGLPGLPGFGGRHHRDADDADDEAPATTTVDTTATTDTVAG